MNEFFVDQAAFYASYHRHRLNRLSHFFGIPTIIFALFVPLAMIAPFAYPLTGAVIVYALATLFYLWLDWALGIATGLIAALLLWAAHGIAALPFDLAMGIFAAAFIGGWILQLLGHFIEGRRPAFTNNLLQLLIAPIYMVAEAAFALGFLPELERAIEARWRFYADDKDSEAAARP